MKKRLLQWVGFLVMVAGFGLLASPFISGAIREREQQNVVAEFHSRTAARQETTAPTQAETEPQTVPATQAEEQTAPTEDTEPQETVPAETDPQTAATSPNIPFGKPAEGSGKERDADQPADPNKPLPGVGTDRELTKPEEEPTEQEPTEPEFDLSRFPEEDQRFYLAAKAYNESLLKGAQNAMTSLASLEYHAIDSRKYGYSANICGTIRIPRMDVELGLYLGANADNMAKGAAVFGLSSIPLGLPSENVAIAGHRGWAGTAMFRDIQMLQMNDPIYVATPWADLVYRVCAIEIVEPNNTTWCRIREGRTLITLMTCHPYGQHTHRYVVYAELTDEEMPGEEEIIRENEETYVPGAKDVILVHADGTREIAKVESAAIDPNGSEYSSLFTDVLIVVENKIAGDDPEVTETAPQPDSTEPDRQAATEANAATDQTAPTDETAAPASATVPAPTAAPATAAAPTDAREIGTVLSNVVILAENKMRTVAYVMAGVVVVVGLWLAIATVRDARREKGEKDHDSD